MSVISVVELVSYPVSSPYLSLSALQDPEIATAIIVANTETDEERETSSSGSSTAVDNTLTESYDIVLDVCSLVPHS